MKQRFKRWLFHLLGKDPEGVVVLVCSGAPELASAIEAEIRGLTPDRRHFLVEPEPGVGVWKLAWRLRRRFRGYRVALVPILFTEDRGHRALRLAAFLLAPFKVLAFNSRLERHHLSWTTPIASLLFLRGVPLDRILLRPRWLCPWRRDRTITPAGYKVLDGRPLSALRRRVAVVSPYFPYPLSHGGAVRIFNLLREAAVEFDIFLFAFEEDNAPEEYGPVLQFCAKVVLAPKPRYREPLWSTLAPPEVGEYRSPALRRQIERFRREYGFDVMQVEYTGLARYGGDVLVEHDVTFDLHRQVYERERTLAAWWNWWRWHFFETRMVKRFARVVVMSGKDQAMLGAPRALVVANGVDLRRFRPAPETPGQRLLFIGSFRHFPNVVAYRFFTEEVWPLVRERFPEATLTVVAGPDPLLYWRAHTNSAAPPPDDRIRRLEFVRDVAPLYHEANLVIVPTLVSAGTNVKVLEAMAMERAVVSTPSGCAGLGLEHKRSAWIAQDAAQFAEGVSRLLREPELRRGLARTARQRAEREFDWTRLGEQQRLLWREFAPPLAEVRRMASEDLAAVERIQQACPEAAQWAPASYLNEESFVALAGGTVAGFLAVRQTAAGEHEVLNLAVAPEFRRRGAARLLLDRVLGHQTATWFLEVRESNTPAQRLYESAGFREIARRPNYYEDTGESAVVMRRQSC